MWVRSLLRYGLWVLPNIELALDWANRPFVGVLLGILLGVVILFIGRWFAKLITRYATHSMERARLDSVVVRFLRTLIYLGLMAAVVIAALDAAGLHTTSLTALLMRGRGDRPGPEGHAG